MDRLSSEQLIVLTEAKNIFVTLLITIGNEVCFHHWLNLKKKRNEQELDHIAVFTSTLSTVHSIFKLWSV